MYPKYVMSVVKGITVLKNNEHKMKALRKYNLLYQYLNLEILCYQNLIWLTTRSIIEQNVSISLYGYISEG